MKTLFFSLCAAALVQTLGAQQKASVTEAVQTMKTYAFSDPDPVADPSDLFYPYFRFDGFSAKGVDKPWKTVTLENDYIQLSLFPEVGGKVWGAVDKSTGKEFIYNNHVVKFRDIAMRGPWCSGGIEFNFGIIGHAPTSSTPVDYLTESKSDGSVSCYISSYELVTRTYWTVEVNLPKDKAYFTTKTTWYNSSSIDQPYYQWMNAGYKAAGNTEFCYPGTSYIGHGGELNAFPTDEEGHNIAWYEQNNFGNSKSYHVLGKYNDFYGAYWHQDDFGSVHHSDYDSKLGMKIFLWGHSREGGIWEDLLTDTDGQYVELQSGRMFNQPASNSGFTPYKHTPFGPEATDTWTEYWYPVKGTKGISKASRVGALNVIREDGFVKLYFSPLQQVSSLLKLYDGDKLVRSFTLNADVMQTWKDSLPLAQAPAAGHLKVVIGNDQLVYSECPADNEANRPKELPADFDWNSAYGLYTQGQQWMNQKVHDKAEQFLTASVKKDPYFLPALTSLASLYYRQGRYEESLTSCRTALSINTYDGEANYVYGLCNRVLGNITDAKDGFSIASHSPAVRSAAYAKLAELFLAEQDEVRAEQYALKSLDYNTRNLNASQVLMVVYRQTGQSEKAAQAAASVLTELPLYHMARFEKYLQQPKGSKPETFTALIRNELPFETYMEMAEWYESVNCPEEAMTLLAFAGTYPIANYKMAYLLHQKGDDAGSISFLEQANAESPRAVFPFRPGTLKALEWAATVRPDWKINYYQGLIYWANQDKAKALQLFNTCDAAAYAPFYLSRASLKQGADRLADLLKAEQTETSWRTGFALMNYYTANAEWAKAVETGKKYGKLYPDNYYIGLKQAKALCETGAYPACIALLNKLLVLPNEGSYAGRAVYREANIYQAMASLAQGKSRQAMTSLNASKAWPENLGVGKPFDDQIDSRLEDFVEARIYAGQGNTQKEAEMLRKVTAYAPSTTHFRSGNLLSAFALQQSGDKAAADRMVEEWSRSFPDNRIVEWCTAIYRGDQEKASHLMKARYDTADTTPWESSYRDTDLDLIIRLFAK